MLHVLNSAITTREIWDSQEALGPETLIATLRNTWEKAFQHSSWTIRGVLRRLLGRVFKGLHGIILKGVLRKKLKGMLRGFLGGMFRGVLGVLPGGLLREVLGGVLEGLLILVLKTLLNSFQRAVQRDA